MKIAIVDYGAGNLPSVERALTRLGVDIERAAEPDQVASAQAIVLPGVGHFGAFVEGLRERSLTASLRAAFDSGKPVLGICLGLQAMFAKSEEAPGQQGLALFPEEVRALPTTVKSPHIGWNQLRRLHQSKLLRGLPEDAYFYFAHSYAAPDSNRSTAATCFHGIAFPAVVEKQNIYGVQFHPEKSGDAGSRLLENFLRLAA